MSGIKGGISMSLDFHIGLRFTNVKSGEIKDFDFANWRKCYGLARNLVQKAMPKALISTLNSNADYELELPIQEIEFIIQALSNDLINHDSELWTDSVWSPCQTRVITCDNLKNLMYLSEIYELFRAAYLPIKNDDDLERFHQSLHVLFDHGCQDWVFESSQWLYETLQNISDYSIHIYIINSY